MSDDTTTNPTNLTTQTTAATPRETAFADAAEALQTIATGAMALLSAVYNLIDEASKKEPTVDTKQTNDAPPTAEKGETTPAPEPDPTPQPPKQTPAGLVTPDDITKACVALIRRDRANSQRIQALLQTYGVSQMSALDPSKYEAFLKDLEALES